MMNPVIAGDQDEFPIRRVERLNWIVAALLTVLAWFLCPFYIAKSVFIGGLLANVSYLFLKKDLNNFLQGILLQSGREKMSKVQFYLKYYARLATLAVILFILVKNHIAHPLGLLVGLSAIVLSIIVTVSSVIRRFYFTAKEA